MSDSEPIPGAAPPEAIKPKPQTIEGVGVAVSPLPKKAESKLDIDQVKKELIDPRTISKKHDSEERGKTAGLVLEARTGKKSAGEAITKKEERLGKASQLLKWL